MSTIEEIRATLLPPETPEPADALTYDGEPVHPGTRVRVRPFLHVLSPVSGSVVHPVRFAPTRPARVSKEYTGIGLVPVDFDDEFVAQAVNGAGYHTRELHKPACTCAACRPHAAADNEAV